MSDVQSSSFSEEDENLLARIAMAEAEGEDVDGKALVILTVLNRVNSNEFPDTIHDVIYQPINIQDFCYANYQLPYNSRNIMIP